MKYIRTENGIYRTNGGTEYYCEGEWKYLKFINVYKQADTIEELCDMTVVVDDETPSDIFELEYGVDKELMTKYRDIEGVILYGAIWTPKGLIYVAKMNDKGELKLL